MLTGSTTASRTLGDLHKDKHCKRGCGIAKRLKAAKTLQYPVGECSSTVWNSDSL